VLGGVGERLHPHRNAVSYRVHWITELLGVHLDDPGQRLASSWPACRARMLR
jgi:DNA-binding PucR family transcriptional regulator